MILSLDCSVQSLALIIFYSHCSSPYSHNSLPAKSDFVQDKTSSILYLFLIIVIVIGLQFKITESSFSFSHIHLKNKREKKSKRREEIREMSTKETMVAVPIPYCGRQYMTKKSKNASCWVRVYWLACDSGLLAV